MYEKSNKGIMDAGNLGESILTKWCHQVGLIPNKATIDKDGWDFLVALPKVYDDELKSLDKDDSHDRILVQVKTTKNEKGNRDIKVSNLKKLVETPMPSFYLLVQVSEDREPVKAHLFHVWEKIIAIVQKKLRSVPIEKWNQLNKFTLRLPWSAAQEMKNLHGSELQRLILKNLTNTKKGYSIKKNELREKIGYEKDRGKIKFEGILPDKYKDDPDSFLVDLFLGEIEKVDLTKFSEIDKRFGQEIVINKGEGGHFRISNIESEGEAKLIFNTSDHRAKVEFETKYFVPRGIGNLVGKEKIRILYKTSYVKFSLFPYSKEITYNFNIPDFSKKTPLSELINVAQIMLFLNEISDKESIEFEIQNDGKQFIGGNLNFSKYIEREPLEYFRAIKATHIVLNYLNIDSATIIKPNELRAQLNVLEYFQKILAPKSLYMKIEFSLNTDLASYKKTVALLPLTLTIGEYVIPIQVSVEGEPEKTGESNNDEIMYTLNSNDVRIEQYRKLKRGKNSPKETHKKMDEISIHKYDVNKDVMVVHFDDKT